MANLNIEPGDATFEELIGGIERGVYMETNSSWSIDDARNKFQFSCEWGQLIEDGVPVMGVVHAPVIGRMFRSRAAGGAAEEAVGADGAPVAGSLRDLTVRQSLEV